MPRERFLRQIPALLDWYSASRRELPWRSKDPPDPYEIWISEVMSQQSTMASVVPYFERWMRRFPTIEDLAAAPDEAVLEAWSGLGYYSRARNVLKAARLLVEFRSREHQWPMRAMEWQSFPGIGPYTAAAVAAIAFGDAVLPVDGNVFRVFSRFAKIPDPLNSKGDKDRILELVGEISTRVEKGSHGALAQAFMELGARICRPGAQAQCEVCPLRPGCECANPEAAAAFPKPKKRAATEKVKLLLPIFRDPKQGGILVRKIPEGRRLAGHWELPIWELGPQFEEGQLEALSKEFHVVKPIKHQILHRAFEAFGVEAGSWSQPLPEGHAFWRPEVGLPSPLTTLTRKLFKVLQNDA